MKLTVEQIAQSVLAAYDSVTLINELKLIATLNVEQIDALKRNKEHLVIMLAKDWFVGGCTPAQVTELTAKSI